MPDAAPAVSPDRPGPEADRPGPEAGRPGPEAGRGAPHVTETGPGLRAQAGRAEALVREALGGEPTASLLGPGGPLLTAVVTGLYVAAATTLATLNLAVSFALLPLVLAALTLSARAGALVAVITYATALLAELVLAPVPDLGWLEIVELVAVGGVSLALRLVVVRLTRGRAEIVRVAAEVSVMQAQVAEAREATERWVGPAGGRPARRGPDGRPPDRPRRRGDRGRRDPGDRRLPRLPGLRPRASPTTSSRSCPPATTATRRSPSRTSA